MRGLGKRGQEVSASPSRQPLTPMTGGGRGLRRQRVEEAEGGGGGRRKGSGRERVNPLCIKLERFIIYHYTKPEIYTQLSLTPTKSTNIIWGRSQRQSTSSRQWAKLICKYIQGIKKLNYTGK